MNGYQKQTVKPLWFFWLCHFPAFAIIAAVYIMCQLSVWSFVALLLAMVLNSQITVWLTLKGGWDNATNKTETQ